jgi:integrase
MAERFIRQRGNTWQVIVHAGRDPLTGKRRNPTGTAHTKREAQALRARLLTQVDEGRRPATDATVAQLLERWLEMADLAWSTRVTYKGYIERTILPTLGHLPLRRLDTATLDRFYTELRVRGGVGGRPMAPATVRQVHAILRRALDQAARWGWIPANPAALASPPRLGSAEIRPPTPEEVSRLLETAYEADPDFAVLLWLAATTGARRGELCALRWGSIDLEAAELWSCAICSRPLAAWWRRTPRPTPPAGWPSPRTAWRSWRSIGAAAPSGRRPAARGSPTMPMCSPSTRLAARPCTRTR